MFMFIVKKKPIDGWNLFSFLSHIWCVNGFIIKRERRSISCLFYIEFLTDINQNVIFFIMPQIMVFTLIDFVSLSADDNIYCKSHDDI